MQPVSKLVLLELHHGTEIIREIKITRHNIIRVKLTYTFVRGVSGSKCPTIIINVVNSMHASNSSIFIYKLNCNCTSRYNYVDTECLSRNCV